VNQFLDRNIFQTHAIFLNKSEHFAHSFTLSAIGRAGAGRLFLFTKCVQGFADDFFDRTESAGFQLLLDDFSWSGVKRIFIGFAREIRVPIVPRSRFGWTNPDQAWWVILNLLRGESHNESVCKRANMEQ
jgi:hypothetical protein